MKRFNLQAGESELVVAIGPALRTLRGKAITGKTHPPELQDIRMNQPTNRPLNIVFVQAAPCIRNYKMASALRSRGHRVTLLYNQCRLSDVYPHLSDDVYDKCIQFSSLQELWSTLKRFDVAHCHNQPDNITVAALAGPTPVIHDTHDLISLRADWPDEERTRVEFFEGVANRGAHGRVYATPYQQAMARDLYGVTGESLVLPNYVLAADLPTDQPAKLSEADGKVHIVYAGRMGRTVHLDFGGLFVQLGDNSDICVHIYPSAYNEQLAEALAECPNVEYNHPISPRRIIGEMARYDIGIIPFNLERGNQVFLDSTLGNKFFEYLAAGLPVLTSPLKSYTEYFADNPVGVTFATAEELVSLLPRMKEIAAETDWASQVFTYESEIQRLEAFYNWVIINHGLSGVAVATVEAPARNEQSPSAHGRAASSKAEPAEAESCPTDASDAEAAVDQLLRDALSKQFGEGKAPQNPGPTE